METLDGPPSRSAEDPQNSEGPESSQTVREDPSSQTQSASQSRQAIEASANQGHNEDLSFAAKIGQYKQSLDAEYQIFEGSLTQRKRDEELVEADWDDLQKRYQEEMNQKIAEEQVIIDELSHRFKVGTLSSK